MARAHRAATAGALVTTAVPLGPSRLAWRPVPILSFFKNLPHEPLQPPPSCGRRLPPPSPPCRSRPPPPPPAPPHPADARIHCIRLILIRIRRAPAPLGRRRAFQPRRTYQPRGLRILPIRRCCSRPPAPGRPPSPLLTPCCRSPHPPSPPQPRLLSALAASLAAAAAAMVGLMPAQHTHASVGRASSARLSTALLCGCHAHSLNFAGPDFGRSRLRAESKLIDTLNRVNFLDKKILKVFCTLRFPSPVGLRRPPFPAWRSSTCSSSSRSTCRRRCGCACGARPAPGLTHPSPPPKPGYPSGYPPQQQAMYAPQPQQPVRR